ncbi:unnamed protein product [Camellia sinensis]
MFDLPYWKTLKLRHNLDVMHIEKNICDNVVGTLLSVDGKNKDTDKARLDLEDMKIRKELHLKRRSNGSFEKPPALYTLSVKEREGFCDFLKSMKYPDGYAANISNCVTAQAGKLSSLKSHDSHVLIQRLLPIGMRGYLNKEIGTTLFELGNFFKQLYEEAKQASDHLGWGTSCFLLVGDTAYNGNQLESDPIRSAIIDSCIRVTDNGRESIQRKVFFIFTLYNTSNHNDQLKLGASSPEEAALHVHNFQEADQNPGDVGSPRSDWQSLSEALEKYSSTTANISASTDQQTVQDWKMVPGLKIGRLRKKTLTQLETDSPAAIPLGSPVAPSPVLPVRSNVEPSHHVTSQPMVDSDETQAPSETQPRGVGTSKPLRVRGPTLGKGIQKIIRAKKGEKCYVHIDRGLNVMTGKYATPATNELGIQIRTLCPLKDVKSWLDLDETTKAAVIQAVLDKFQIGDDFHNDLQAQEIVNKKAYGLYKDWRYTLKQEFELLEGLPRDEIYAHPPVEVSLDDWKHLIDVAWQDASHQKRSKAGKSNRSQLPYNHTNGSRSFPIAMAAMVAKNGELDFPKFYEDSHTSKKTNDWIHPKCRELHQEMVNVQAVAIESGTPLTQEEISMQVLGQKKRYLLGFGSGPQPSTIFAARAHDKDMEAMRAEVEALREERQKDHDELMTEREERERCYNELLKEREERIKLSNEKLKEQEERQKAREETNTKVEHLNNVVAKLSQLLGI